MKPQERFFLSKDGTQIVGVIFNKCNISQRYVCHVRFLYYYEFWYSSEKQLNKVLKELFSMELK